MSGTYPSSSFRLRTFKYCFVCVFVPSHECVHRRQGRDERRTSKAFMYNLLYLIFLLFYCREMVVVCDDENEHLK